MPGPELASVASDPLGVSGRAMLEALVSGTHDPHVLAELARGRLRAKLPALREALEGRFGPIMGCWSPRCWPASTRWTSRSGA